MHFSETHYPKHVFPEIQAGPDYKPRKARPGMLGYRSAIISGA